MLPFPVALFSPLLPPFKRYACSHRALTGLTRTYILFINLKECLVSRSTPFNVLFGPSSTTSNGPLYVCICIIICISITLYWPVIKPTCVASRHLLSFSLLSRLTLFRSFAGSSAETTQSLPLVSPTPSIPYFAPPNPCICMTA